MEEIKRRIETIKDFTGKKLTTGFMYTNTEFVCLQFRKILELIALANLVSNKELYAKQHANIAYEWRAKQILDKIEKLNPNFYPKPQFDIIDEETGETIVDYLKDGYLTRDEFSQVYDECSELMHAENPFAPAKDLDRVNNLFIVWLNKIIKLLDHHSVDLVNTNFQLWVIMESAEDGEVFITLMKEQDK